MPSSFSVVFVGLPSTGLHPADHRNRPMALPPNGPIRFFLSQELLRPACTESSNWRCWRAGWSEWWMVWVSRHSVLPGVLLILLVLRHRDLSVLSPKSPFQLELLRVGFSCSYQTDLHGHAVSPHSDCYQHYAKDQLFRFLCSQGCWELIITGAVSDVPWRFLPWTMSF